MIASLVTFAVGFGVFIVLLAVLVVAVVRFVRNLGRRDGPPPQ
jgi:membrane protein implicated in regulation of membrane protease activity